MNKNRIGSENVTGVRLVRHEVYYETSEDGQVVSALVRFKNEDDTPHPLPDGKSPIVARISTKIADADGLGLWKDLVETLVLASLRRTAGRQMESN